MRSVCVCSRSLLDNVWFVLYTKRNGDPSIHFISHFIISWSLTVSQDEHESLVCRRERNNIEHRLWMSHKKKKSALKTIPNWEWATAFKCLTRMPKTTAHETPNSNYLYNTVCLKCDQDALQMCCFTDFVWFSFFLCVIKPFCLWNEMNALDQENICAFFFHFTDYS